MSTQSTNGESTGANLLTGAIIAASAFMLYASLAVSPATQAVQAGISAAPAIEQVVVTASRHVS